MRTADGIAAAVELHGRSGWDHVLVLVGERSSPNGGRLEFHDLAGGDQRPGPVRGSWSIEQGKLVVRFDTPVGEHERAELVLG